MGLAITLSAQNTKISGSGQVITENRSVGNFDGVAVGGAWKVTLQKGNEGDLTLTTDDNLMKHVETYVKNGTLYVGTKDVYIKNVTKMEITINFSDIESLRVSGACSVEAVDEIKADRFDLRSSGASKISINLTTNEFDGKFSGASKTEIAGSAKKAELSLSGAGTFYAYDFSTQEMRVGISGAGSAKVHVSDYLKASVSGAGSVKYKGSPDVEKKVSGAGSVKSS